MPNAGKSTLIAAISNARPKIADHPFTTLHPQPRRGAVAPRRASSVADVPGLIEGARRGHRLGILFLRHLQRTQLLLHVVDIAPFDEAVDPVAQARHRGRAEEVRPHAARQAALAGAEQDRHGPGRRACPARARQVRAPAALEGAGVRDLGAHPPGPCPPSCARSTNTSRRRAARRPPGRPAPTSRPRFPSMAEVSPARAASSRSVRACHQRGPRSGRGRRSATGAASSPHSPARAAKW